VIINEEIFSMNIPGVLENWDLKNRQFAMGRTIPVEDMKISKKLESSFFARG
jgi:hypothetical protein